MKKYFTLFFFSVWFSFSVNATHDNNPIGARSAGMGNASVTFSDIWSAQNNQAGLGFYTHTAAGIYYENRFLTKELSLKSGAFVLPTNSGVLAVTINNLGYKNYNENKIGLAYAKAFTNKFSVGIQLDYLHTYIAENYGSKSNITFEAGLLYRMNSKISIGAHVFNPVSVKLTEYNNERIPAIMQLGLSYKFSDKVLAAVETEKDMQHKAILKAGLEYKVIKEIYLRAGISSNPLLNTFGFGLEFGKLKFDFASSFHPTLGYSPQISFIYNFGDHKGKNKSSLLK
jgi:hypothetical protein